LAALTLRLRANWIKLFGDADTAAIALAIVAITADRLLREELEPGLENLAVPLPTDALASCNISSIAIASGFNRETARRKVDQLVDAGFLLREGGKIRLSQSLTQRAEAIAMVRQQVEDIRKAANDLLREGVLAIEE
jgi:predicted transcriptional regulator